MKDKFSGSCPRHAWKLQKRSEAEARGNITCSRTILHWRTTGHSTWATAGAGAPIAGFVVVLLLTLSGCIDGRFTLDQTPRLSVCTGTDPSSGANNDPTARTHEDPAVFNTAISQAHDWCSRWGQSLISGFDLVNRYENDGSSQRASYRAFQYLHQVTEEWLPGNNQCDGHYLGRTDGYILEYWPLPAYDTISSFRCCEGRFRVERNAEVAILDLDDLDAAEMAGLGNLATPTSNVPTIIDVRLVPPDVARKLRDRTEKDKRITWNSTYEYDGCNHPPQTSCHERQCVTGGWKDEKSSGTFHVP